MLVGDFCNGRDVNRVKLWVSNGLRINRLGVWLNRRFKGTWVEWIDKRRRDAELWQRMSEEVPRTAIQTGG